MSRISLFIDSVNEGSPQRHRARRGGKETAEKEVIPAYVIAKNSHPGEINVIPAKAGIQEQV